MSEEVPAAPAPPAQPWRAVLAAVPSDELVAYVAGEPDVLAAVLAASAPPPAGGAARFSVALHLGDGGRQYRVVSTAQGLRIASCYVRSNAELVANALNAMFSTPPAP